MGARDIALRVDLEFVRKRSEALKRIRQRIGDYRVDGEDLDLVAKLLLSAWGRPPSGAGQTRTPQESRPGFLGEGGVLMLLRPHGPPLVGQVDPGRRLGRSGRRDLSDLFHRGREERYLWLRVTGPMLVSIAVPYAEPVAATS
jgi:hypothetical protein